MLGLWSTPTNTTQLLPALVHAAGAIARLSQVASEHPLRLAFLYRARLDAVRRQAAVDGQAIDPWHLAAMLEGLRLRMDGALRIVDRGAVFDAARLALTHYQWLTAPDFDQEGVIQEAEACMAGPGPEQTPLLAAAAGLRRWIDQGGTRPAGRAALIRFWMKSGVLQLPIPLTGPAAFRAEVEWDEAAWIPTFLDALGDEAEDWLQLLVTLERAWFSARNRVTGRRKTSHAGAAIDILAAVPLVSASTLAKGLGIAINNASALLDAFRSQDIVVELTGRSKRRLFSLTTMAPLRDAVDPPRRPMPGRGRGRPPLKLDHPEAVDWPETPAPPLTPMERWSYDYSDMQQMMADVDLAIGNTRRMLERLNIKNA